MALVKFGGVKLLYAAPERFKNEAFRRLFSELDIGLLAVDEAHCVSEWGHDFRPEYLAIGTYLSELKHRPTVAAFTATATPEVKNEIIRNLGLRDPSVFVRGFDRPNLSFFVQAKLKKNQRKSEVVRIVKQLRGAGIVYAISRKETEEIARFLRENGISATHYHAGLEAGTRKKVQEDFMENKFQVIVATVAFGMGVDKADIRFVIHAGMPGSLEGYYQEAGRAGRDGEQAWCILLHSGRDTGLHKYFIRESKKEMTAQGKSGEEIDRVMDVKYARLNSILGYVETRGCRRGYMLAYFADPDRDRRGENCGGCDVCMRFTWDHATPAKKTASGLSGKSDTVMETAKLYRERYPISDIAKIRSLGIRTIFNHLARWYAGGGEFDYDAFVPSDVEDRVLSAMARVGDEKLKPIKQEVPDDISYEQIKFVMAKIERTKQGI
jgi:ATP-dependent DNA helicase RecQ